MIDSVPENPIHQTLRQNSPSLTGGEQGDAHAGGNTAGHGWGRVSLAVALFVILSVAGPYVLGHFWQDSRLWAQVVCIVWFCLALAACSWCRRAVYQLSHQRATLAQSQRQE